MDELKAYLLLELNEDADIKDIKKAYARKIREIHPEDDPVGYQQIKDAYEYLKELRNNSINQSGFSQTVVQEEPYIEIEDPLELDFDDVLQQAKLDEIHQQKNIETAIQMIETYLRNKKTPKVFYEEYFKLEMIQSMKDNSEYLKQLLELCKQITLPKKVRNILIKELKLKENKQIEAQRLYECLSSGQSINVGFIVFIAIIIFSQQLFHYTSDENKQLFLCIVIQFIVLFSIYLKIKHIWSKNIVFVLMVVLFDLSFMITGIGAAIVSDVVMSRYIDLVFPIVLLMSFAAIIVTVFVIIRFVYIKLVKR